jgi:hypothetical protein
MSAWIMSRDAGGRSPRGMQTAGERLRMDCLTLTTAGLAVAASTN